MCSLCRSKTTFVTGSKVAACEKATSVNDAGRGLEATSAANVRLWTSRKACRESCHRSSTNLQSIHEANELQLPSWRPQCLTIRHPLNWELWVCTTKKSSFYKAEMWTLFKLQIYNSNDIKWLIGRARRLFLYITTFPLHWFGSHFWIKRKKKWMGK